MNAALEVNSISLKLTHALLRDAKPASYSRHAHFSCQATYDVNVRICDFSLADTNSIGMCDVGAWAHPLKVVWSIVLLVPIFVVDLIMAFWCRPKESFGYDPVDVWSVPAPHTDVKVSDTHGTGFQCARVPHAPQAAHFISVRASDSFPNLAHYIGSITQVDEAVKCLD